jgi:hypothetical protein
MSCDVRPFDRSRSRSRFLRFLASMFRNPFADVSRPFWQARPWPAAACVRFLQISRNPAVAGQIYRTPVAGHCCWTASGGRAFAAMGVITAANVSADRVWTRGGCLCRRSWGVAAATCEDGAITYRHCSMTTPCDGENGGDETVSSTCTLGADLPLMRWHTDLGEGCVPGWV